MRSIIILMFIVSMALCQTTVSIPVDSLPADLKVKYAADVAVANSEKAKVVAENAESIGKSVGSAMREGLSAITSEANKFADTKVGMFTAVIIAWKVMGEQAANLVNTLIFLAIFIPIAVCYYIVWFMSFRNHCIAHKIPVKKTKGEEVTETFEYTLVDDSVFTIHWWILIVSVLATAAILGMAIFG